jgi:DNA-binding MarR family transcriptional regulator
MNLTIKQIEIMKVVAAATAAEPVDLDQLLERLPYATTKESLQFSLRAIERHGLIDRSHAEHRRGRLRRLVKPTDMGRAVIGGTGRPAPGPGSSIGTKSDEPQFVASSDPRLMEEVTQDLPEPELLSLPELSLPEPVPFLEEEFID